MSKARHGATPRLVSSPGPAWRFWRPRSPWRSGVPPQRGWCSHSRPADNTLEVSQVADVAVTTTRFPGAGARSAPGTLPTARGRSGETVRVLRWRFVVLGEKKSERAGCVLKFGAGRGGRGRDVTRKYFPVGRIGRWRCVGAGVWKFPAVWHLPCLEWKWRRRSIIVYGVVVVATSRSASMLSIRDLHLHLQEPWGCGRGRGYADSIPFEQWAVAVDHT